ncbi:ring-cleaving dioxygenase [Aliifodinibius salipaludis]|uniref:Ring-cleaving dioxygenase n=1 Tax=Fodinibius salipaludis TaxID=2032627 RepID=A0A2A2GDF7_9BACT|nr:VOC family protein [Aliifodinibius salipaludis]PAU94885.1 ring-cleaving dioxygenase [Aliifodinibius salipaludis]
MSHSKGIHHITAVAGDPKENHRFYTEVLGLRLVKKTVNFDDPSVYHLYYGDASGNPGTILTFFPWEHLQDGDPDRGQVVAVSFSVPTGSKTFWLDHLREYGLDIEEPFSRFGKEIIGLQDPDGLHLELVLDPKANIFDGWSDGPIPQNYAIRGIHGATLGEENYSGAGRLLEDDLGFELTNQFDNRYLYESDADFGATVEIIDGFDLNGRPGKGTVHHIAFRVEDEKEQQSLRKQLLNKGYYLTEVKDRDYFKSVYFHEPGGILFEIATDPPGFTRDEEPDELGTSLKLPDWLEHERSIIEKELPTLNS